VAAPAFLDTLDTDSRELLLSVARPVSYVPTSVLVRHGEPARGAYILRSGTVDAVVTLPGGESLTVATLGPGSVFGEMALIELGTCTATVRAASPVEGWFVAHEDFRAIASQAQPAALRLQHALTAALATKLAALNERMLACSAPEDRKARTLPQGEPLAALTRTARPPFDAEAFLPRLPLFEHFAPAEVDEVLTHGSWLEVARGQGIFTAGSEARAAFVVVRGAVEILSIRAGLERRVAVIGPGQLLGYLSVLRGAAHSTCAFARETSLLVELPAAAFNEAYFGTTRASARLRLAVQRNLLGSMARTNRALTRLLSLERLARRPDPGLEAAYHSQLATAAPL
jgi:CRP-like cAMP-binding protein